MEEEQIIRDIVESLYGNDVLYNTQDTDTMKQIRKEKDEKFDEILHQINVLCERIENNLKITLGNDDLELGKIVRTNVIETIQMEIASGNSILDSNGKINGDKIYSNVLKKKDKIINEINLEENENINKNLETEIGNETNKEEPKKNIRKRLDDLGLDLTDEENERLETLILDAENIINEYNAIIENEQLSPEEAIEKMIRGKTRQEIDQIVKALNTYAVVHYMEERPKEDKEREDTPQDNSFQEESSIRNPLNEKKVNELEMMGKNYIYDMVSNDQEQINTNKEVPTELKRIIEQTELGIILDLADSIQERLESFGEFGEMEESVTGKAGITFIEEISPMEEFSMEDDSKEKRLNAGKYIDESLVENLFSFQNEYMVGPYDNAKEYVKIVQEPPKTNPESVDCLYKNNVSQALKRFTLNKEDIEYQRKILEASALHQNDTQITVNSNNTVVVSEERS